MFLPNISRVCASKDGIEPRNAEINGMSSHCNTKETYIKRDTLFGRGGRNSLLIKMQSITVKVKALDIILFIYDKLKNIRESG